MLSVQLWIPTGLVAMVIDDNATVLSELRGGRFRGFVPIKEAPNLVLFKSTVPASAWLSEPDCIVAKIVKVTDLGPDLPDDTGYTIAEGTPLDELHLCGITHGKYLNHVLVIPYNGD